MADPDQGLVFGNINPVVSGIEAVVTCALFLLRRAYTDREANLGTSARYTLIGEYSSFLPPFKSTNQHSYLAACVSLSQFGIPLANPHVYSRRRGLLL